MALVLTGPKPGTTVTHTPTARENHKLDEPMRVRLTAPSNSERRELATDPDHPWETVLGADGKLERDDKGAYKVKHHADREQRWRDKLLRRYVAGIDGYLFPDGEEIDNVDKLLQFGDESVIGDIYDAVCSLLYLSGDAAKPSAGPSDSSPQAIRLSSGTAADVEKVELAHSATADLNGRTPSLGTPPAG